MSVSTPGTGKVRTIPNAEMLRLKQQMAVRMRAAGLLSQPKQA